MYKCPNCGVQASINALRKLATRVQTITLEEAESYSDTELRHRICWCCDKEVHFVEVD